MVFLVSSKLVFACLFEMFCSVLSISLPLHGVYFGTLNSLHSWSLYSCFTSQSIMFQLCWDGATASCEHN